MNPALRHSDDIADQVASSMLQRDPDPSKLITDVASGIGIGSEDAARVLYGITRELNNRMFMPVTKAELILVEGCNLACSYCFESKVLNGRRDARRVMSREIIQRALGLLFDYSRDSPNLSITLFGGEPTLHMPGVEFAVADAERRCAESGKSVRFNMTSNGVLFTEEMVNYFAEHNIKVLLSIDGLAGAHDQYRLDKSGRGTYQRVIAGLNLLKKRQPWVGTKMTIMPSIANTIAESVAGLHELGVNQFLIGHATGVPWSAQDLQTYQQQMQQLEAWYRINKSDTLKIDAFDRDQGEGGYFGCGAGRNTVAISCDGSITGCSRISTLEASHTVGELGNVDIGLYNLPTRLEMNQCGSLRDNCAEEGIEKTYTGGCFATNYEATGDLFKPNLLQHQFSVLVRDIARPGFTK